MYRVVLVRLSGTRGAGDGGRELERFWRIDASHREWELKAHSGNLPRYEGEVRVRLFSFELLLLPW